MCTKTFREYTEERNPSVKIHYSDGNFRRPDIDGSVLNGQRRAIRL